MVICLGPCADLHMAQLMPLPLTVSCSSKFRFILPSWFYLVPAYPGSPRQNPRGLSNGCVCVCVFILRDDWVTAEWWSYCLKWCGSGVYNVDSSSESDDADNNFYSMSEVRRRNRGHQLQDHVQRQSQLCVTLSINKGRFLACTASQVCIALQSFLLQRYLFTLKSLFSLERLWKKIVRHVNWTDRGSRLGMTDDHDRCEWVNVSSGSSSPR